MIVKEVMTGDVSPVAMFAIFPSFTKEIQAKINESESESNIFA